MTYIFLISAGTLIGALLMGFMAVKALDEKDATIKRLGIENQTIRGKK